MSSSSSTRTASPRARDAQVERGRFALIFLTHIGNRRSELPPRISRFEYVWERTDWIACVSSSARLKAGMIMEKSIAGSIAAFVENHHSFSHDMVG
jgi:hypothetical protein